MLQSQVIITCERPSLLSRGDGGIDIFSNYQHYLLLFQCKDLSIYVTSAENGYSSSAKARAESSDCHLLLTNFQGLCQNISDFLSEVFKDNSLREMIYRIEKKDWAI
ncbi:6956_t:CDS:2 [Gigaspora rosea]|nr:6956_t:CDS:2 [Gigaspora rosea]